MDYSKFRKDFSQASSIEDFKIVLATHQVEVLHPGLSIQFAFCTVPSAKYGPASCCNPTCEMAMRSVGKTAGTRGGQKLIATAWMCRRI
jgi:hypothetical protein